jgi:peptide chain release factor 3
VLKSRLRDEYELEAELEASPFDAARWISAEADELEKFAQSNRGGMAADRDGAPVFLAKSAWEMRYVVEKFPKVKFAKTRERSDVHGE